MHESQKSINSAMSKVLINLLLDNPTGRNQNQQGTQATLYVKRHLSDENGEFMLDQGTSSGEETSFTHETATQESSSGQETSYDETTLYDSTTSGEHTNGLSNGVPTSTFKPMAYIKTLFSKFGFSFSNNHKGIINNREEIKDNMPFLSSFGTLLHQRLGRGVSAKVQLAQGATEIYAVKIFRKRRSREGKLQYLKVIAAEFCTGEPLEHENVVKTFGFVRLDDHPDIYCIVMEYCPDGDLYSLIKRKDLQDDEIFDFFGQLIRGLEYLHSMGIAHRDIKPENLLLRDNTLKIADFGSADVFRVTWQENCRLSDGLCGTTPYMAPEIFMHTGYWGPSVDMWAAGVVLFCMKCNGVPFGVARDSDLNYSLYTKYRFTRSYKPFSKFKKQHRELIYKLLNPNPDRRFQVGQVLTWMEDNL